MRLYEANYPINHPQSKIYTRLFFDLAKSGSPRVNYQAIGSGSRRKAFIDETVNFGTDSV